MKSKKGILAVAIVAVVLVICSIVVISSHPWRYVSITRRTDVSKDVSKKEFLQQMEKLDEYYDTTNFSEIADLLFDEAQERGYDVYLAPAVMCIETNGGTTTKARYNYWTQVPYNFEFTHIVSFKSYLSFKTQEASIKWFFDKLDKEYENVTYEEFARKWTRDNFLPAPRSVTETSDAYGKNLYKTVKWIQSL